MSENLSRIENEDSIIGSQNPTLSGTNLPDETSTPEIGEGDPAMNEHEAPTPQNSPDETPSPATGDGNTAVNGREAPTPQNSPDETPSPATGEGDPAVNGREVPTPQNSPDETPSPATGVRNSADNVTTSVSTSSSNGNQGNEYGKLFLIIVGIFSIFFIGYIIYSGCVLRKSQDAIKQTYYKHISKADSLYVDLMNYNKDVTSHILEFNSKVVADSLIRLSLNGQKLSSKQYESLSSIILNHSNVIEHCIRQYEAKIYHDSLRLCTERDLLEGQTKTMVDLHLNKIEHEYTNITIWAAILTIIFLVFSFYSLYKADELIKQGREGVKDISMLKNEGEEEIIKLQNASTRIISETEARINTFIEAQTSDCETRINQLLRQYGNVNTQMNNVITQTHTYLNSLHSNGTTESNNNGSTQTEEEQL